MGLKGSKPETQDKKSSHSPKAFEPLFGQSSSMVNVNSHFIDFYLA